MRHDEFAHLDAAYVLGALGPDERRAYEQHLDACAACARSVREMAGMPALLGHVDESVFLADKEELPVPDTLLPGLLREVHRTRRRRMVWAGAAAAAVIAVSGVVVWQAGPDDAPVSPTVAAEPMRQVDQSAVRASLAMEEVAWGTRLELTCSYVGGGDGYATAEPPSYSLAVQTRDGAWQQVATWQGVPGRTITVSAATAAAADDIASVEVRTLSGDAVLELDS
jgi:hypothetical protein